MVRRLRYYARKRKYSMIMFERRNCETLSKFLELSNWSQLRMVRANRDGQQRPKRRRSMTKLISIIGTPSSTLYATMNILRAVVQVACGDHCVVIANSVKSLIEEFPTERQRDNRAVILFSDYPDLELLSTIWHLNAPVTVCIDDLISVARFAAGTRGLSPLVATRFATMGLVKLDGVTTNPPRALANRVGSANYDQSVARKSGEVVRVLCRAQLLR